MKICQLVGCLAFALTIISFKLMYTQ